MLRDGGVRSDAVLVHQGYELAFLPRNAAAAVFSWENMENSTRKWSFEWENHRKLMPKMGKVFYKWEVQKCFNNMDCYIYIYPEMEDLLAMFDYRRVLRSGVTVKSSKSWPQISKHLRC